MLHTPEHRSVVLHGKKPLGTLAPDRSVVLQTGMSSA